MLLPDAREAMVTTCQELSRAGIVVGTAGNVSVRDGKADSAYMREADVVLVAGDYPDVRVSVRRMPSSG